MIRVGVFICHCGSNIANTVDVERVAAVARTFPNVVYSVAYKYVCSDPGQNLIKDAIKEHDLNRVVVASCSPRMHGVTFMSTVSSVGVNPYFFEMANIREHCSWAHKDRGKATEKAIALVRTAVAKAVKDRPLQPFKIPVTHRAMVIGGGVAGIQAALDIAEAGHEVILVEREPSIGGRMAQLDKTFPTLDCSACILTPKMVDVGHNERIKLMTYAEVEDVSGYVGNFKVKIRKKARYVDVDNCKGCGECEKVCPVTKPNEFDMGLGKRKAIYRPFPQAVPGAYVIDKADKPAPCVNACPAGVNAHGYISLIAERKFKEALALVRQENPFPAICGRVCTHPCESACNRKHVDAPLAIASLKRFIADLECSTDERAMDGEVTRPGSGGVNPPLRGLKTDKVAIVGGGPAGLTAAWQLAKMGYSPTIFEALPEAGGMLRYGIPEYRLPKRVLDKEIEYIKGFGVTIKTGVALGRDFTIEDLKDEGYKAVFLAIGTQVGRRLDVPGEDLEGVVDGVTFLREVAMGNPIRVGGRVAVIGGGNTAIDAARTAIRKGAEEVRIIYRRSMEEMPANPEEVHQAQLEGVQIDFLAAPVEVLGENGKVKQLKCIRMELGEVDSSGRRRPVPVEGSEFLINVDMVIPAISQVVDASSLKGEGLEMTRWGTVSVDPSTMQTGIEGVFAGGDSVSGPATVIEAIAAGKKAAKAIDHYLSGEDMGLLHLVDEKEDLSEAFPVPPDAKPMARQVMPTIPPEDRISNFDEVEAGFTEEMAVAEAKRCLHCTTCCLCRECEKVCEAKAIHHEMKDEVVEVEVGAIIVATGFKPLDPTALAEYGYGRYPDVITSLEFERLINASGPTGGHVIRPSNGEEPKSIVFIKCVGSRDEHRGKPYCSKTCCMYTAKQATLVAEKMPGTQRTIFYMDVRTPGKGYDEFYRRTAEEYGVRYIRGRVGKVFKRGDTLVVRGEDTLLGRQVEVEADLVVLATAMVPQDDAAELARKLSISYDENFFFTEAHPKLRPVETNTAGIFLAGACQGPKDIPESVAQATAAAGKACIILGKAELEASPIVARVDTSICSGDMACAAVCPFKAIEAKTISERVRGQVISRQVAEVNKGLCQGCGACTVACRSGAINLDGFTNEEILAEVDAICL